VVIPGTPPWPSLADEAAQLFLQVAAAAGVPARITSTVRTRAQQTRLYKTGAGVQPGAPVALPGTSTHEWGLAFDLVADNYDDQAFLGELAEFYGLVWGGRFSTPDPIHFQLVTPLEWSHFLGTDWLSAEIAF